MTQRTLAVQAKKHLREAGERGLSPGQLARITGCTSKAAQAALGRLWADFECWRWYCKVRRTYVYTQPEVQLDEDRQLLHSR